MSVKLILCGLLTLVTLAGPILLCIGVALFHVPSERPDWIDEFNEAGRHYSSIPEHGMKALAPYVRVNGLPATAKVLPVEYKGVRKNVEDFSSEVIQATVGFNITAIIGIGNLVPVPAVPGVSNATVKLVPSAVLRLPGAFQPATARASFGICEKDECSVADMWTSCRQRFGNTSQYTGTEPCERGLCNECGHISYMSEACYVIRKNDAGVYVEDSVMRSCFYPFSPSTVKYGVFPMKRTFTVTLRTHDDPFMVIQRLTEGTMDFGTDVSADRRAGLGLLIVGSVLTFFLIFVCFFWYRVYVASLLLPSIPDVDGKAGEKGVEPIDDDVADDKGEEEELTEKSHA